jgi:hypothetical protein
MGVRTGKLLLIASAMSEDHNLLSLASQAASHS